MTFNNIDNSFGNPPWSRIESLSEICAEAGVDFDEFIEGVKNDQEIETMAEQFGVQVGTIEALQEHFFRYGIGSIIGGD